MPRVKRGTVRRAKRKKLLGLAKGYYANKSKLYRAAKESVDTALKYAFVGRRRKKRDFRRLWVVRINAAAREHGLTYGQFINGLKTAGVTLDRKSLSELAIASPAAFATLAKQAKAAAKTAVRVETPVASTSTLRHRRRWTTDTEARRPSSAFVPPVDLAVVSDDHAPAQCRIRRPLRSPQFDAELAARARPPATRRPSATGTSAARTASSPSWMQTIAGAPRRPEDATSAASPTS